MGAHVAVAVERIPVQRAGADKARPVANTAPVSQLDLAAAEDRVLVAAFLAGSQDAFNVIVTRHQRTVYQVCYRFMRNQEDASDLAQDVFVRAFKGLKNFKGDSSLSTWLYRVGVNCCLNRLAVKRPETESIEAAQRADHGADDPLRAVVRGEKAAEVRRAIAQLPPKQRATLLLRVYQELSHEEIARVLGGSVGAAKANFFHALGNLKRLLES
jgi:RNA polymerase sigma-70 factor (ECF subfamily)